MYSKVLSQVRKTKIFEFLSSIDNFIFDCDGVIV